MTHTSDALADYVTSGYTLPHYAQIFTSNTLIANAMSYSSLPSDFRTDLWTAFNTAWGQGYVSDVTTPTAYPADPHIGGEGNPALNLTRAELKASYLAKVAHAFTIEALRVFPWNITTYNTYSCESLFKPEYLYFGWDPAGTPAGITNYICDHSPYRAYTLCTSLLDSPDSQREALDQVIKAAACYSTAQTSPQAQLLHSAGVGTPGWVETGHPWSVLTMDHTRVSGNSWYNNGVRPYIARGGCHYTARFLIALMRSINIPALHMGSWYNSESYDTEGTEGEGSGHASAVFPTIPNNVHAYPFYTEYDYEAPGLVLGHGDHCYSTGMSAARGVDLLQDYSYYQAYVTGQAYTARDFQGDRLNALMSLKNPSSVYYLNRYQTYGWSDVEASISPYLQLPAEQPLLDKFHQDLAGRSGQGKI